MVQTIYRNNNNFEKHLNVIHYDDGHYYFIQFMEWTNFTDEGIKPWSYKVGTNSMHRCRKSWLMKLVDEDYHKVFERKCDRPIIKI